MGMMSYFGTQYIPVPIAESERAIKRVLNSLLKAQAALTTPFCI